jgi:hypothetical protein
VRMARAAGLRATRAENWPEMGLKALRLDGHAPRAPRGPQALQETLFPYAEAL